MAKERGGVPKSRINWNLAQVRRKATHAMIENKIRENLNPPKPQPGLKNQVLNIYEEKGLSAAQKFFKANHGPYTETMFWQWIEEHQRKNGRSMTSKNDRDDGR